MAISICNRFEISENDVSLSIHDLMKFSKSIEDFHKVINSDPKMLVIDFYVEGEEVPAGAKITCMVLFSTMIGDFKVGCLIGLIGLPTLLGGKQYKLIPEKVVIESPMIAKVGDVIEDKAIDNRFDNFAKRLQQDGMIAIRIEPVGPSIPQGYIPRERR